MLQASTTNDEHLLWVLVEALNVVIDLKPGSDPNCFNVDGNGVIPVAILGASDFDVSDIDTTSLDDPANWFPGDGVAGLTGQLLDGMTFEGEDSICVVP